MIIRALAQTTEITLVDAVARYNVSIYTHAISLITLLSFTDFKPHETTTQMDVKSFYNNYDVP